MVLRRIHLTSPAHPALDPEHSFGWRKGGRCACKTFSECVHTHSVKRVATSMVPKSLW